MTTEQSVAPTAVGGALEVVRQASHTGEGPDSVFWRDRRNWLLCKAAASQTWPAYPPGACAPGALAF